MVIEQNLKQEISDGSKVSTQKFIQKDLSARGLILIDELLIRFRHWLPVPLREREFVSVGIQTLPSRRSCRESCQIEQISSIRLQATFIVQ